MNKASFSITVEPKATNDYWTGIALDSVLSSYSVSKDFSSVASGVQFGFFIAGHDHRDEIFKHNTYPIYQINSKSISYGYTLTNSYSDVMNTHESPVSMNYLSNRTGKIALAKIGVDTTIDGLVRDIEVIEKV